MIVPLLYIYLIVTFYIDGGGNDDDDVDGEPNELIFNIKFLVQSNSFVLFHRECGFYCHLR